MNFREIEDSVLVKLLAGDDSRLIDLRMQVKEIRSRDRWLSGTGFVTRFVLTNDATPLVGIDDFRIGDVNGSTASVRNGLGFILFGRKGFIDRLEGFTYGESWPESISELTLTYNDDKLREFQF